MTTTTKTKVYPNTVLQRRLAEQGISLKCLWEIPGPKNTGIAWITAYAHGGTVLLVQTFKDGFWEAYLPSDHAEITATVEQVAERLKG